MIEKLNVRLAKKTDADLMVEFNQAMAMETEGKSLSIDVLASGVEAVFKDSRKGFYIVAENDSGKIIGGLMISFEWSDWRNAWFWWIESVYVLPESRGNQIYSRLYDFAKEKARENGNVFGFRLYVEKENSRAKAVYIKVGMEETRYLIYEEEI